jgi:hypothetical protein
LNVIAGLAAAELPVPSAASVLLVVLLVASVFVTGALVVVVFWWKYVQNLYQEAYTKLLVEAVQVLTAFAAIGGTYAAIGDREKWLPTAVAGAVCLGLTKLTQVIADLKSKQSQADWRRQVEEWRGRAERAEAEGVSRTRLMTTLRDPVKRKLRRVQKEADARELTESPASIKHLRKALGCKPHLEELLFNLGVYLQEQLPPSERDHHQFRVGLYLEQDGVMRPVYGVSTRDPDYNPFTSHREHEQFFRLDSTSPVSHTVRCVREKKLIIVPDCEEAKNNGTLIFFNGQQPSYLKSLVACYIGKACGPAGGRCEAALVIDTNKAGHFKLEDVASIRFTLEEFAARLELELSLLALMSERKRTHHDNPNGPAGGGAQGQTARQTGEDPSPGDEA